VWRAAGRGIPWLTLGWAAFLLMVFVFEAAIGATGDPLRLLALGGLSPDRVAQGEMDRLFTSAFLHSSGLHLLMNATSLIVLGVMFERLLGWARFLVVLSFAQIAGTGFWVTWPNAVVAVGASAALYGIVGCWLFLHLANREELPVFLRSPAWNWMLLIGLALWIEVGFSYAAHAAHLGGFAGGFAAGAVVVRGPLDRLASNRPRGLSVVAGACILVWASALGAGIQRAWGPLDARRTEIGLGLPAAEEAERSREERRATPPPSGGRRSSRAPRRAPGRSGLGCARLRGAR
jgi:membrane associated rhomboid family serine protease